MLITTKSKEDIRTLKARLNNEFEMKDLGVAMKILEIGILRDRVVGRLSFSHKGYIEKVLHRFNMKNAKPVTTPLAAHFRLSFALCPQSDEKVNYMSRVPYSSVVGSLMYAMVCSSLDLVYAVSAVNKYMAKLGKKHWKAFQWIMQYLHGSSSGCLQFGRTREGVVGYVGSDYAGDLDKRRSLRGYVFTIGGCANSWKATLQSTIALSTTTKAEYMVVT